jgi:O-antigen/teichoic acid export membrane protein
MHANIGSLPENVAPKETASGAKPERLISLPYLLLRVLTAGGAFAMGFVQTFVLARVLPPDRFSIFIVAGGIGYSLWITDLGLAKILFVKLRAGHLAGKPREDDARQATAVILFYVLLGAAASLVCIALRYSQPSATLRDAVELGLFLLFITLNLSWYSLRSLSIAVDVYVYYEKLELARRIVTVASMLAMLAGLPLLAFLIGVNALWGALHLAAAAKLISRNALVPQVGGIWRDLIGFFRLNWNAIARSGTGALSGVFVATFPYYFVPVAFGLGAAPIILEVTFRIFRGASVIYAAACDLTLPAQTRALADGDFGRMVKTTWLAVGLCGIPALFGCAVLIFAAGPLFKFLLHAAATVPPQIASILVVLLLVNIVQIVAEALLQHTGYFRSLAYVGALVAVLMVAAAVFTVIAKLDIVGFLTVYTAAFTVGTIVLAVAAVMGPIRATSPRRSGTEPPHGLLRTIRNALRTKAAVS